MSKAYQDSYEGGPATQSGFSFPPLTSMVKVLIVVNLSVYAVELLLYLAYPPALDFALDALSINPPLWRDLFPFVPFWQLVTYGFLHDVSPGHVLWNMLMLYFFGTIVESILGPRRFLVTYIGALLAGVVLFLAVGLATGRPATAVGASGAALGMVVAAACFRPDSQVILIIVPLPLKVVAIGIVALNLISGALSLRTGADGTAHLIHLGGILYGFIAVKKGYAWRDPIQRLEVRRAISKEEKRLSEEQRMDDLLKKIHREGMHSLSKREKDFLKRVSGRR